MPSSPANRDILVLGLIEWIVAGNPVYCSCPVNPLFQSCTSRVADQNRLSKSAKAFSSAHCARARSFPERSFPQPAESFVDRGLSFWHAEGPPVCHRPAPGRKLYATLARANFFSWE